MYSGENRNCKGYVGEQTCREEELLNRSVAAGNQVIGQYNFKDRDSLTNCCGFAQKRGPILEILDENLQDARTQ